MLGYSHQKETEGWTFRAGVLKESHKETNARDWAEKGLSSGGSLKRPYKAYPERQSYRCARDTARRIGREAAVVLKTAGGIQSCRFLLVSQGPESPSPAKCLPWPQALFPQDPGLGERCLFGSCEVAPLATGTELWIR